MSKHVLFIHGAGAGAYEADAKLMVSLRDELGSAYQVQYPQMPNEDQPAYEPWKRQIMQELAALDGEILLVGHSLGGSVLLKLLCEEQLDQPIAGLFLVASPYWGAEDWKVDEYMLQEDFALQLPPVLPTFFYHSHDDKVVPFEHLARYAQHLPQATIREVNGGGHQFNNNLSEVAQDIKRM